MQGNTWLRDLTVPPCNLYVVTSARQSNWLRSWVWRGKHQEWLIHFRCVSLLNDIAEIYVRITSALAEGRIFYLFLYSSKISI